MAPGKYAGENSKNMILVETYASVTHARDTVKGGRDGPSQTYSCGISPAGRDRLINLMATAKPFHHPDHTSPNVPSANASSHLTLRHATSHSSTICIWCKWTPPTIVRRRRDPLESDDPLRASRRRNLTVRLHKNSGQINTLPIQHQPNTKASQLPRDDTCEDQRLTNHPSGIQTSRGILRGPAPPRCEESLDGARTGRRRTR